MAARGPGLSRGFALAAHVGAPGLFFSSSFFGPRDVLTKCDPAGPSSHDFGFSVLNGCFERRICNLKKLPRSPLGYYALNYRSDFFVCHWNPSPSAKLRRNLVLSNPISEKNIPLFFVGLSLQQFPCWSAGARQPGLCV